MRVYNYTIEENRRRYEADLIPISSIDGAADRRARIVPDLTLHVEFHLDPSELEPFIEELRARDGQFVTRRLPRYAPDSASTYAVPLLEMDQKAAKARALALSLFNEPNAAVAKELERELLEATKPIPLPAKPAKPKAESKPKPPKPEPPRGAVDVSRFSNMEFEPSSKGDGQ